jgi:hypothetical protein
MVVSLCRDRKVAEDVNKAMESGLVHDKCSLGGACDLEYALLFLKTAGDKK